MENIKFKYLSDESTDQDLFEEKTHIKLAKKIFELISNNKGNAVTIGLEGRWGSGKSTIINLLKKNLEDDKVKNQYQYIYIDAWAHEGDPLRRIFLEKIIQQVDPNENDKDLTKIKLILSKRQKTITTTTTKSPTVQGIIIALLVLFVPFGQLCFQL